MNDVIADLDHLSCFRVDDHTQIHCIREIDRLDPIDESRIDTQVRTRLDHQFAV